MITTDNTQKRIIKAMENGAELVFHWCEDTEGGTYLYRVTLERNGQTLDLSTLYRNDEYQWDDRQESYKMRHGEHSRPETSADVARRVIKCPEIRSEYAGYRGDYDKSWRKLYVHNNRPVPRWVSEQWGPEQWQ